MSALDEARRLHNGDIHAQISRAQATAYVWGRQDAGDGEFNCAPSLAFGEAFKAVSMLYLNEAIWSKPSIQGAFVEWRTTGRILVHLARVGVWAVWAPDEYAMPVLVPIPWADDHTPYWSEDRRERKAALNKR